MASVFKGTQGRYQKQKGMRVPRRKSTETKILDDVEGDRPRIRNVDVEWFKEVITARFGKIKRDGTRQRSSGITSCANEMGLGTTQLSRRVTGRDSWSAELVARFCLVAGVEPADVLNHCTAVGAKVLKLKKKAEAEAEAAAKTQAEIDQGVRDALIKSIKLN